MSGISLTIKKRVPCNTVAHEIQQLAHTFPRGGKKSRKFSFSDVIESGFIFLS